MQSGQAEIIAIQALNWIASDTRTVESFLGSSGIGPADLETAAADPAFLAAVLDFLLTDERHVIGFCDDCCLSYETPMQARGALVGGEQVNWT
ncbi:MAG: DUF3572 domain-containing protein [Paracoccaceae bacterium]